MLGIRLLAGFTASRVLPLDEAALGDADGHNVSSAVEGDVAQQIQHIFMGDLSHCWTSKKSEQVQTVTIPQDAIMLATSWRWTGAQSAA